MGLRRVVIAGGHGQIALLLAPLLTATGREPVGLIRNREHAADLASAGATALHFDLEQQGAGDLAEHLRRAEAVVFAAGAGPGSGAERKLTVDRDGAIKLLDAAREADVRRYVMISAIGADLFDPAADDVFQVYLRAKSEADRALRESGLDWTVVRPGRLTDDPPTGRVSLPADGRADIPRADVAAVVAACLDEPRSIGAQFDVVSGDVPVAEALAAL